MEKKIYNFINLDLMLETVSEIYDKKGREFCEYYEVPEDYVLEFCEEEAFEQAVRLASDFKKYCNSKDHSILGNFNNVRRDFEMEHKGKTFREILAKLNAAIDDEETREFKDWAFGWFWETFGTYNLGYNFSHTLDAVFCEEIEEWGERQNSEAATA